MSERSAEVFRGEQRVLEVADHPGVLLSTAAPPPDGAPAHPFVNARAYDPFSEGELAALLGQAADYDDFLRRLRSAGFTVVEHES